MVYYKFIIHSLAFRGKRVFKKKKKEFDTSEDTVKTKDMNKRQIIKLL